MKNKQKLTAYNKALKTASPKVAAVKVYRNQHITVFEPVVAWEHVFIDCTFEPGFAFRSIAAPRMKIYRCDLSSVSFENCFLPGLDLLDCQWDKHAVPAFECCVLWAAMFSCAPVMTRSGDAEPVSPPQFAYCDLAGATLPDPFWPYRFKGCNLRGAKHDNSTDTPFNVACLSSAKRAEECQKIRSTRPERAKMGTTRGYQVGTDEEALISRFIPDAATRQPFQRMRAPALPKGNAALPAPYAVAHVAAAVSEALWSDAGSMRRIAALATPRLFTGLEKCNRALCSVPAVREAKGLARKSAEVLGRDTVIRRRAEIGEFCRIGLAMAAAYLELDATGRGAVERVYDKLFFDLPDGPQMKLAAMANNVGEYVRAWEFALCGKPNEVAHGADLGGEIVLRQGYFSDRPAAEATYDLLLRSWNDRGQIGRAPSKRVIERAHTALEATTRQHSVKREATPAVRLIDRLAKARSALKPGQRLVIEDVTIKNLAGPFDFSYITFRGCQLIGMDIGLCNLRGARFEKCAFGQSYIRYNTKHDEKWTAPLATDRLIGVTVSRWDHAHKPVQYYKEGSAYDIAQKLLAEHIERSRAGQRETSEPRPQDGSGRASEQTKRVPFTLGAIVSYGGPPQDGFDPKPVFVGCNLKTVNTGRLDRRELERWAVFRACDMPLCQHVEQGAPPAGRTRAPRETKHKGRPRLHTLSPAEIAAGLTATLPYDPCYPYKEYPW